jgi:hypothetical protein
MSMLIQKAEFYRVLTVIVSLLLLVYHIHIHDSYLGHKISQKYHFQISLFQSIATILIHWWYEILTA